MKVLFKAPTGFEPVIEDLQSSALPLGYGAKGIYKNWAGRIRTFASRDQNPLPYRLATAQKWGG